METTNTQGSYFGQFKKFNRASNFGILVEFHSETDGPCVAVSLFKAEEIWFAGDPVPTVQRISDELIGDIFLNMGDAQKWGFSKRDQLISKATGQ